MANTRAIRAAVRPGGSGPSGRHILVANARLSSQPSDQRTNRNRVFWHRSPSAGSAAYLDSQICGGRRRALGQCQRSANSVSAGGGGGRGERSEERRVGKECRARRGGGL